ncbi:MAG: hypothetical protein AABY22_13855 [Nanoarchaeota archaeon]
MKNLFVDCETSKMLKELEFDLEITDVLGAYDKNGNDVNWTTKHFYCWKPLLQQVEQWIFDKHKIHISVNRWITGTFDYMIYEKEKCIIIWDLNRQATLYFNTPTEARIAGIKNAVEYLHRQTAVAVTPINTSANGT